ncbi:VOC family protein [Pedobacter antarcticus]|uniref:VOC family protein n=1 Tax=Pedobacter antarcticus TaxID=34086 RepID=UPI00087ED6E6|nr:VOC family protein [Pedobacter antarcticus]SDM37952.1 Catechol 2,3-dioxygenase [Pedobacter antarcticus]
MTSAAKNTIIGLHHIAIRAIDFENTLSFYTSLGFTTSHSWSLPEFNLKRAAMLRSPDGHGFIELYDANADIPAQGRKHTGNEEFVQTALLHICLTVTDADQAFEQALAAGATPCLATMELQLGTDGMWVRNSLVYSPNGEVIEFLERADFY